MYHVVQTCQRCSLDDHVGPLTHLLGRVAHKVAGRVGGGVVGMHQRHSDFTSSVFWSPLNLHSEGGRERVSE